MPRNQHRDPRNMKKKGENETKQQQQQKKEIYLLQTNNSVTDYENMEV